MKYCRKCGTPNKDDTGVCIYCQALLQPVAKPAENVTETTIKDLELALREAEIKKRLDTFFIMSLIFIAVLALELLITSFITVKYQSDFNNIVFSSNMRIAIRNLLIISYTSLGVISFALLCSLIFMVFALTARIKHSELSVSRFSFAKSLRGLSILMTVVSSLYTAMYMVVITFTLILLLRYQQPFPSILIIGVFTAVIPLICSVFALKISKLHKQIVFEDLLKEQDLLKPAFLAASEDIDKKSVTDINVVETVSRGFMYEDFLPYSTPAEDFITKSTQTEQTLQTDIDAEVLKNSGEMEDNESLTPSTEEPARQNADNAAKDSTGSKIADGIFEEKDGFIRVDEEQSVNDIPPVWLSDTKDNNKNIKKNGKHKPDKK